MSKVNIDEGNRGEEMACEYLQSKGYKIIDRNFRLKGGEIDIVAVDPSTSSGPNGTLVFVEVKTRTSYKYGTGFEAITSWKLKALIRSANFYKISHKNLPDQMRIDAVSILLDSDGTCELFEHMENISF